MKTNNVPTTERLEVRVRDLTRKIDDSRNRIGRDNPYRKCKHCGVPEPKLYTADGKHGDGCPVKGWCAELVHYTGLYAEAIAAERRTAAEKETKAIMDGLERTLDFARVPASLPRTEKRGPVTKSVPELISMLVDFEKDRDSANMASVTLENLKVPKDEKPGLKLALRAFISGSKLSERQQDQVALQCAMRRYVYIQGDAVYDEVEGLLRELPADPPANHIELLTTLTEFLWVRTPPALVESAPDLVRALEERCETSLVAHLLTDADVRIAAVQSLLALILMGRPEAEALIDKAMLLGPARRYLSQRAEDMTTRLTAQGTGSPETRALLNRIKETT